MNYEYKKYIHKSWPLCVCGDDYYDHDLGTEMTCGNYSCDNCSCERYHGQRKLVPKNVCERCFNIIPPGARHEKVGYFDYHSEKCIEYGPRTQPVVLNISEDWAL